MLSHQVGIRPFDSRTTFWKKYESHCGRKRMKATGGLLAQSAARLLCRGKLVMNSCKRVTDGMHEYGHRAQGELCTDCCQPVTPTL